MTRPDKPIPMDATWEDGEPNPDASRYGPPLCSTRLVMGVIVAALCVVVVIWLVVM